MPFVLTEICEDTGSWLRDIEIDNASISFQEDLPIIVRNIGNSIYKSFIEEYEVKTKSIVIRKTSLIEDSVGYQIHTNRELHLMLKKKKPLSVFSRKLGQTFPVLNGQKFSKFSSVIRSKRVVLGDIVYYFKYRDSNEWRVKAYIVLQNVRRYSGNSKETEAVEGELLGYSEEQNIEFERNFLSKYMYKNTLTQSQVL